VGGGGEENGECEGGEAGDGVSIRHGGPPAFDEVHAAGHAGGDLFDLGEEVVDDGVGGDGVEAGLVGEDEAVTEDGGGEGGDVLEADGAAALDEGEAAGDLGEGDGGAGEAPWATARRTRGVALGEVGCVAWVRRAM
jgi:hypothetical protein